MYDDHDYGVKKPTPTEPYLSTDAPAEPHYFTEPVPAARHRRRTPRYVIALVAGGVLLVLGGGLIAGGALISASSERDPGVQFCEAIRDDQSRTDPAGNPPLDPMTFEEYQEYREALSSSRHEQIRTHAVALVDAVYQFEQLGQDPGLEALPLANQVMEAYSGLVGGCAEQGIEIPANLDT